MTEDQTQAELKLLQLNKENIELKGMVLSMQLEKINARIKELTTQD